MVWKIILKFRKAFLKGTYFTLKSGLSIRTWEDPWVPNLHGHVLKCKARVDGNKQKFIVNLRNKKGKGWNEEIANVILSINQLEVLEEVNSYD